MKRILLIDDEEVILFGYTKVLQEPGVEVDCARTAEEAKGLITARQYDAAIVDLRLSNSINMEGYDLIRLLRSCQKGCRIIVLTAYGDNCFRIEAKALGADLFYEKPMEPENVKEFLREFGIYSAPPDKPAA